MSLFLTGGRDAFSEGGSEPGKARNKPPAARGDGPAGRRPEEKAFGQDPFKIGSHIKIFRGRAI